MRIIGIETSTRRGSVAVVEDGRVIAEEVLPEGRRHSASLVPALDSILKRNGIALRELGGIASGIGPGSFTGIRLGLATARGLAMALGIPLRGVSGFDILLAAYRGDADRVCPVVNAHSYGLYAAVYERRGAKFACEKEPFVCRPEELAGRIKGDLFFLGPDLGRFRDVLGGAFGKRAAFDRDDSFPRASFAALLYEGGRAVRDDEPPGIAPLYILPGVRKKSVSKRVL